MQSRLLGKCTRRSSSWAGSWWELGSGWVSLLLCGERVLLLTPGALTLTLTLTRGPPFGGGFAHRRPSVNISVQSPALPTCACLVCAMCAPVYLSFSPPGRPRCSRTANPTIEMSAQLGEVAEDRPAPWPAKHEPDGAPQEPTPPPHTPSRMHGPRGPPYVLWSAKCNPAPSPNPPRTPPAPISPLHPTQLFHTARSLLSPPAAASWA